MRYLLLLSIALSFQACSREKHPASAPSPQSGGAAGAIAVLENTSTQSSAAILSAAAAAIQAKRPLATSAAEQCWMKEKLRPEVGAVCLLAWSIGGQRSILLEKALAESASTRRLAAIAAVRLEFPLYEMSYASLTALLTLLAGDPPWIKARAASIWLRGHSGPSIGQAEELKNLVISAPLSSPADFRLTYELLREIKPAQAAAMIESHCGALSGGDLEVRCWRFLSAFLAPGQSRQLPPELQARMPPRGRAWQLFQIGMPIRARLFP